VLEAAVLPGDELECGPESQCPYASSGTLSLVFPERRKLNTRLSYTIGARVHELPWQKVGPNMLPESRWVGLCSVACLGAQGHKGFDRSCA
jgi:hypothetical protein